MNIFKKKPIPFNIELQKPVSSRFEVDNWKVSEFVTQVLVPIVGVSPYPITELHLMTATVLYFKPDAIFEWGTHIGKSARIFYETIHTFNVHSKVYSVDLPDEDDHPEHPHLKRGMMVKNISDVTLLQGDGVSLSLKISNEKKCKKPLFFLDGDHMYSSVSREIKMISDSFPTASILAHDTFPDRKETPCNGGPKIAIHDFLQKNQHYTSISMDLGLPGMTLLYRK